MHFDFRRTFNPTPEEEAEDRAKYMAMFDKLAQKKRMLHM